MSAVCGVLVAGLMVPAVALTGTTASSSISFFDDLPSQLEIGAPAQSTKILASDGSLLANFYNQNRVEVGLDQMSPFIKDGIIAIEDARFYEHGGIDTTGILRAAAATFNGSRQGASTITQQYVNNVIIQTKEAAGQTDQVKLGTDKTVGDKVREMKLAIALEKKYSKDDILKGYLNLVYFNNNNYGIEAASDYYFGVHAKDLTLPQAALLAGVVNSPDFYDPTKNPENAKSRRDMVLGKMLDQGKITKAQHDEAVAAPVQLNVHQNANGCYSAVRAGYFCDYVQHLIQNDPAYGATADDRRKLLFQGGLTIKTTLNPALQDTMQAQVDAMVPPTNNPDKVGHSMVTVQPGTGQILAMAQNTQQQAPAGQWSNVYNFNVDSVDANGGPLGGAGGFAPGSTMKPFTFAEWLNSGHTLNETVQAQNRRYPASFQWKNSCGTTLGIYDTSAVPLGIGASPDLQNAEENYYRPMSALQGLYSSINTATFAEAAKLDMCNIQKMMTAAGIHNGQDGKSPWDLSNVSNIIGAGSASPLTMVSAFATFADGGVHCDPVALLEITDAAGNKYPVPGANCAQTIKPEVAAGTTAALQEVLKKGSGYNVQIGLPSGAKTGTSDNSVQTWTVGFTKGLATASWVGNPDQGNRSLNGLMIANTRIPYVDGATYAGVSWQQYMKKVAGNFDTSGFPNPPASMVSAPAPVAPAKPNTTAPSTPAKDNGNSDNSNSSDNAKKP